MDEQQREEYALHLLAEGKTTISRAAELAGIDVWSFIEMIQKKRVPWVKDRAVLDDIETFSL